MTKEELRQMYQSKQETVRKMNELTEGIAQEWEVLYLQTEHGPFGGVYECIRCYGPQGDIRYINVTGTSESAIVKEICRELYGFGAIGKIEGEWAGTLENQWFKTGRISSV